MQLSPLQLEEYVLKDLRFTLISPLVSAPSSEVNYDKIDIEVNAETRVRTDDPFSWRCEVTVRSKDEKEGTYPYSFQLTFIGFFRVAKEYPSDRIEQMVKANAPALLYSASRELLLSVSGRGRFPAILLPSVTFIEPPKTAAKGSTKAPAKKASKKK